MNQAAGIRRLQAERARATHGYDKNVSSRAHVVIITTNDATYRYTAALSELATDTAASGKRFCMIDVHDDIFIQQLVRQHNNNQWLVDDIASISAYFPVPMASLLTGGAQFMQVAPDHKQCTQIHTTVINHLDRYMKYVFIAAGQWQSVCSTLFTAADTILFLTEATEEAVQQTYGFIKNMAHHRQHAQIWLASLEAEHRKKARKAYETVCLVANEYLETAPNVKWLGTLSMFQALKKVPVHAANTFHGVQGLFSRLHPCTV